MEFKTEFHFPGLESHGKLKFQLVLCDRLVTADDKARTMYRQKGVIKQRKRHAFWWTPEFVPVELFKVKKYSKTRKGF